MATIDPTPAPAPAPAVPKLRYTLGPSTSAAVKVAPPAEPVAPTPVDPAAPVKPDVAVTVTFDAVNQVAKVTIPAYSPAEFNVLAEIRTYYLANGQTAPTDADAWVASPYAFENAEVSAVQTGATAAMPVPAIPAAVSDPAGNYLLQVVLGHAS